MDVAVVPPADPRLGPPVGRRTILPILMFLFASALLAWYGWNRGRYQAVPLRVAGPSMVPTLLGEHYLGACPCCGRREIAVDATGAETLPADVPCFRCGEPLEIDSDTVHLGDTVWMDPLTPGQSIAVGQLVAIDAGDGLPLRVKRVAAVGGQTVDHDAGRLKVDGRRIEDRLSDRDPALAPRMLVADESRTTAAALPSRWVPVGADHRDDDQTAWRSENGLWSLDHSNASAWLVYHHVNVHEDGAAAPVMDDYEYNASLMRRLDEVDRLHVTADIVLSETCRIEVAYWLPGGVVLDRQTDGIRIRRNATDAVTDMPIRFPFSSSTRFAKHPSGQSWGAADGVPVTRESPIAIRVVAQPGTGSGGDLLLCLENLRVWKSVTYRLRRHDERSRYPITLREGECFVLGDNVPVSIDSRDHGPIRRDKIAGVIRSPE